MKKGTLILLLIALLIVPWIPYFLGWYSAPLAISTTISGLLAGYIAERLVFNKKKT